MTQFDGRFAAYAHLHAILAKHNPGSPRYEQIEHALDLCLNDGRTADSYFVRNLLRDSKRVLERQTLARSFVPIDDSLIEDSGDPPSGYQVVTLADADTPESLIEAEQVIESILIKSSTNSRHTHRIFMGMLVGESLADTATACGISSVRVNQLRSALRKSAGELQG